jgi:UDPglucose 6-dehydrogenase
MKRIRTDFATAELIKYGWNTFSALRITFVNELSRLCRHLNADIFTTLQGIACSEDLLPTREIRPGPGYGGSCLPKDVLGFSKIFEEYGIFSSLTHQTILSNQLHIQHVKELVNASLNGSVKGKTIAILGLSFKANTDDFRNSPAINIVKQLEKQGASVRLYDPKCPHERILSPSSTAVFCHTVLQAVDAADCVVVLTDAPEIKSVPLDKIQSVVRQKVLVDLRNIYDPAEAITHGFQYYNLGRR